MTTHDDDFEVSPRRLLAAAGLTSLAAATLPAAAESAPAPATTPAPTDPTKAQPIAGLHLQFGADAASEMTVSWHSLAPVERPRVILGQPGGRMERTAQARTVSYLDAKTKKTVWAHHAAFTGLAPDTVYLYAAIHEGAAPQFSTFRTAPRGRAAFTFTSFGDQATPTLGRLWPQAPGAPPPPQGTLYVSDNLGTPVASDTTLGVERLQPLFHLFNGDLCYANLAHDRVRAWWDFWDNNTRSASRRPWMPSPGNHENELGNGPIGYQAYQTYFSVPPAAGQTETTRGLWYAFTVGAVRVVAIANDDVCYQDGGDSYVRGYSNGAQKAWLEAELTSARANRDIDWIVVCMHQVAISTADGSNGADLGIRQEWGPLFDKHGVDLVVCGHEHHYERSHPLRGAQANATLTPIPASTATDVMDTSKGCVHMVLGGGGTSKPTKTFFTPAQCRVVTAVGPAPRGPGKRAPVYVMEDAPWSAVRDATHPYGFAAFTVDPGQPGGHTRMRVTYYNVVGDGGAIAPYESFTLTRPRRG